jgi:hypothetical protein
MFQYPDRLDAVRRAVSDRRAAMADDNQRSDRTSQEIISAPERLAVENAHIAEIHDREQIEHAD